MSDMRDRLIEVIEDVLDCKAAGIISEWLAKDLIANGVILPPCEVGDTVYWLKRDPETFGWCIRQSNVASILIDNDTIRVYISPICWIVGTDIGKTVFLTREAAEKALREKEK